MLWSTDKLDRQILGFPEPQGARTQGLPEPRGVCTPGLPEPQGACTQGLTEPWGAHTEFRSPKDKGAHLMHQSGSLSDFGS